MVELREVFFVSAVVIGELLND
ncbi:hypothetical protein EMIT0P228_260004 [Pseudomonas brassicacearum]